jgi:hypothetical protein
MFNLFSWRHLVVLIGSIPALYGSRLSTSRRPATHRGLQGVRSEIIGFLQERHTQCLSILHLYHKEVSKSLDKLSEYAMLILASERLWTHGTRILEENALRPSKARPARQRVNPSVGAFDCGHSRNWGMANRGADSGMTEQELTRLENKMVDRYTGSRVEAPTPDDPSARLELPRRSPP